MKKPKREEGLETPDPSLQATIEAIKDAFARKDFDQADELLDELRETWRPEEDLVGAGDA